MLVPASRFDDYTVGLICALPLEMAAVRTMLDECHGRPAHRHLADTNSYYLGRIGEHNVVAAGLPSGSPGSVSAATVAAHMQYTFKSIRFGLVVGVGSGVPCASDDIRLGDVVVSTPGDGSGGVVQYDPVAAASEGRFVRTGALNKPPQVLLTAVADLAADHLMDGNRISSILARTAEGKPSLRARIARPPDELDHLFQAHAAHVSDAATCAGCDSALLVDRPTREDEGPVVHYGVIASGNQVLNDGRTRDKLRAQCKVLCFEMEAAGLMDNFPCLVIRGVGDYADAHKSNRWREYAAFTAAAYAKELLSIVSASQVSQTPTILEALTGVAKDVEVVKSVVVGMQKSRETEEKDRRHTDLLEWLTSADYDAVHQDFYAQHESKTGEWLLNSDEFLSWTAATKSTLFCPGIPGAGKTIMASIIINNRRSRCDGSEACLAFVYCNYKRRDEQTIGDVLAILLKQLCAQCQRIPEHVMALYDRHMRRRTRPSIAELACALKTAASACSCVFVVVDALDECDSSHSAALLAQLRGLQSHCDMRLIITSRYHSAIEQAFRDDVWLEIRAHGDDLKAYLRGQMSKLSEHILRDASLQDDIAEAIITAADGMFLLAKLHVDSLLDKRTVNSIRAAVRSLPKGLGELATAYDKTIERIQCQRRDDVDLARKVLCWISHARRPLTTTELLEALAVRANDTSLDPGNFYVARELVKVCAGLVTEDRQSNVIRLIHHTTQDYFERHQVTWIADAHTYIAKTCLTYLSYDAFAQGCCQNHEELRERLAALVFVSYAAVHWAHHMQLAVGEDVEAQGLALLRNPTLLRSACQVEFWLSSDKLQLTFDSSAVHSSVHVAARLGLDALLVCLANGATSSIDEGDSRGRTPLSYAAEEGHHRVIERVISMANVNVNSKDRHSVTPLAWAAMKGHSAVVDLLLRRGEILVNPKCYSGRTPLHLAAEKGHGDVAGMLLRRDDVEPDCKTFYGWTPLAYASSSGHATVVDLLLGRCDVDPYSRECEGRTPLDLAAARGQESTLRLLLNRASVDSDGDLNKISRYFSWTSMSRLPAVAKEYLSHVELDVNRIDHHGLSPMMWAAGSGFETGVIVLLDRADVKVNAKGSHGCSPITLAAAEGHGSIVKLLLDRHDIVADLKNDLGRSALSLAAESGHEAIVKLFLNRSDIDPNARDSDGGSPLHFAADGGHTSVVNLLLERDDVDANVANNWGQSPLLLATKRGHEAIVQLFFDRSNADVNARDKHGDSLLHIAADLGHSFVVKQFLGRDDVKADVANNLGRFPLHTAARTRHDAMVKLFFDRSDAGVNAKDNAGLRPLHLAAYNGHISVVKLFLEHDDVEADVANDLGRTPLSLAAKMGHEAVVKLFLDLPNIDINLKDNHGTSPISLAALNGYASVIELFLDNPKTDVNAKDDKGRSPISHATSGEHTAVVRLLLERADVEVNAADNMGRVPLIHAATLGHKAIVELLLERLDIDIYAEDIYCFSPIVTAAERGHASLVKLFLDRFDADKVALQHHGSNAISAAARNGHASVVQLFLNRSDFDVNAQDSYGDCPLLAAAEEGHTPIVALLLNCADIDVNAKDDNGSSPISAAAVGGHSSIVELLLEVAGIRADERDHRGSTPLSRAAQHGHGKVVSLLLQRKEVNVNARNDIDQTPLQLAAEGGHLSALELLLSCENIDASVVDTHYRVVLLLPEYLVSDISRAKCLRGKRTDTRNKHTYSNNLNESNSDTELAMRTIPASRTYYSDNHGQPVQEMSDSDEDARLCENDGMPCARQHGTKRASGSASPGPICKRRAIE